MVLHNFQGRQQVFTFECVVYNLHVFHFRLDVIGAGCRCGSDKAAGAERRVEWRGGGEWSGGGEGRKGYRG